MDKTIASLSNPAKSRPRLSSHTRVFLFPLLLIGVILFFLLELGIGSVHIPISGVIAALLGWEGADSTWIKIINELRLPRTIAAAIGGAALGTAGLQLQTLFKNPLAGPWALGLTAGAQLGVAIVVTTAVVVGSSFLENFEVLGNLSIVYRSHVGLCLGALINRGYFS